MIDKNYTLEKHLRLLAETEEKYKILVSVWDLNKSNLWDGLNTISTYYPHYSKHDSTHSMTVINNIQCFLGEDRIKNLSATDTFLILMGALTHDIGMILTYEVIEKEWGKDQFKKILKTFSNSKDSVIAESANLLLSFKRDPNKSDIKENFKWALEIQDAVRIITAELFRPKHAELSAEYLGSNKEFNRLCQNFYSNLLPDRFIKLLGDVAFSHMVDFEKVMSSLYKKADGFYSDYIHPRFIAFMIRLGDLLDFDSNRFSMYSYATLKEVPDTSFEHFLKHKSVEHKLISPEAIEAKLNCKTQSVYRITRSWFDQLKEEVVNLNQNWSNIVPENLGGLPPIIKKDSIKILYDNTDANPEFLNLKFSMPQEKMFNFLRGGNIYKEPGFVFIREIVQNALDATKIQLWNDINEGLYDSYFNGNTEEYISKIEFPNDIEQSIYNQYPIKLSVKWNENKTELVFECEDRGTGISEENLLRMTNNVGQSYSRDKGYEELYESMPYWLKPTAAFGIGLQSIFFVAKTFEIETHYIGESSKRIIFGSPADNEYCSIEDKNFKMPRGTRVKVSIKKDRFSELFGDSFDYDILNQIDIFEGDNPYLAKVDQYIHNKFTYINYFPFHYKLDNKDSIFQNKVNAKSDYKKYDSCQLKHYIEAGILYFEIHYKNLNNGYKITLRFNDYLSGHLSKIILYKDIPVSNALINSDILNYMGFEWNFYDCITNDTISLSRDEFINGANKKILSTIDSIIPDCLKLIDDVFESKVSEYNYLKKQYLNYCLTRLEYGLDIKKDSKVLNEIKLDKKMASFNNKEVSLVDIFDKESLCLVKSINKYPFLGNTSADILKNELDNFQENNPIIWGNNYLNSALRQNYSCVKIKKASDYVYIYKLKKNPNKTPYFVDLENADSYIIGIANSRALIYGLKKYKNIVIQRKQISGFEEFPDYASCCIYPPIFTFDKITEIISNTNSKNDDEIKEYIKSNLFKYITPSMIKVVKENNINPNVTEEEIKEEYLKLIYDFVKLHMWLKE